MITKKPPEEVLQDFVDNAASFESGETKLIAENKEFGVEVYLGGEVRYGSGLFPTITVFADDDVVFDDVAYTTDEFRGMLSDVYDNYLSSDFIDLAAEMDREAVQDMNEITGGAQDDELDRESEITEQESLLDEQILAFLAVAYGYDPLEGRDDGDTILEDVKNAFCEACADMVGTDLYRPSYVEGKEEWVFERYPYELTADAE